MPPGAPPAKKLRVEDLPELQVWTYKPLRILGKGSFGEVFQARIEETGEIVAIKSVRTKWLGPINWKQMNGEPDREVQVLKELRDHPNVVNLRGAFLTQTGRGGNKDPHLNLVLEFLSDTLHRVLKHYSQLDGGRDGGRRMDHYYVKLYQFQLVKGLAFVHGHGIVHCDIKPQNLLLDGKTQTLKICDFGTAKRLLYDKTYTSYVCSRYYRAPELILGATGYTTAVDLWSAGCVLGEMLLGQPLFTGMDGINQLTEIIKVIGTPSPQDLRAMNPNWPEYQFTPRVEPHPWEKVYRGWATDEAIELTEHMLVFNPAARLPPLQILMHRFFDSLRTDTRAEHRKLFEFRADELWWCTEGEKERLIPRWCQPKEVKSEPNGS